MVGVTDFSSAEARRMAAVRVLTQFDRALVRPYLLRPLLLPKSSWQQPFDNCMKVYSVHRLTKSYVGALSC